MRGPRHSLLPSFERVLNLSLFRQKMATPRQGLTHLDPTVSFEQSNIALLGSEVSRSFLKFVEVPGPDLTLAQNTD